MSCAQFSAVSLHSFFVNQSYCGSLDDLPKMYGQSVFRVRTWFGVFGLATMVIYQLEYLVVLIVKIPPLTIEYVGTK